MVVNTRSQSCKKSFFLSKAFLFHLLYKMFVQPIHHNRIPNPDIPLIRYQVSLITTWHDINCKLYKEVKLFLRRWSHCVMNYQWFRIICPFLIDWYLKHQQLTSAWINCLPRDIWSMENTLFTRYKLKSLALKILMKCEISNIEWIWIIDSFRVK